MIGSCTDWIMYIQDGPGPLSPGSTDRQRIPTESRQSPDRVPTVRQLSTDRARQSPTELRPHLDTVSTVTMLASCQAVSSCQSTDRQTDRPTDRQTATKTLTDQQNLLRRMCGSVCDCKPSASCVTIRDSRTANSGQLWAPLGAPLATDCYRWRQSCS